MRYFAGISAAVFACCLMMIICPAVVNAIPVDIDRTSGSDLVIPISEKDIPRAVWSAEQNLKAGMFGDVIIGCKEIINLQGDNINAHALMAAAYKGLHDEDNFREEAKKVKKLDPDSYVLHQALAFSYLARKDFKSAEAAYKTGLKKASDKTELQMGLAVLYYDLGRLKEAYKQYNNVLKGKKLSIKHHLNAHYSLCRIDLQREEYDDVIKRARALIDLYPPIPQAYMLLAAAQIKKGEASQAVNTYKELIEANPEIPMPYQQLALIYIDVIVDYDKAIAYAVKGSEKYSDDSKSKDVLGWVYYQHEEYSKALKQFEAANRLEKGNPQYLHHLGLVQCKTGNEAEAKKIFRQALELLGPNGSEEFGKELKRLIKKCS